MKNKEEYPRITVIIPEKNRAEYLGWTLKTCIMQEYPNFEIIVSDDCSDDNSAEVALEMAKIDSRIRVFAHDHHLGMRDNFEFALSQVQPGYVFALGGDDGICAGGVQRMYELLTESGRELLCWSRTPYYYTNNAGNPGRLQLQRKDMELKILRSEDYLNKVAKTFNYLINECPMFYIKGIASTNLIERVKARTPDHCFYQCPTPDGFSGVILAGEVEDYAYTNEPLAIAGVTDKSQGIVYMRKDEKSRVQSEEFFNDNIRRTMHAELASQPYSPFIELMSADYLLTARDLPGWPGKFEMFKFEDLIKACFKMLEKTPYENEVLIREMRIVREIAKQHGLLDLFNDLYVKTKRKITKQRKFQGFLLTPRTIIMGNEDIGINNVYEAAMVTPALYKLSHKVSSISLKDIVKRFIEIKKANNDYSLEGLPQLD